MNKLKYLAIVNHGNSSLVPTNRKLLSTPMPL